MDNFRLRKNGPGHEVIGAGAACRAHQFWRRGVRVVAFELRVERGAGEGEAQFGVSKLIDMNQTLVIAATLYFQANALCRSKKLK